MIDYKKVLSLMALCLHMFSHCADARADTNIDLFYKNQKKSPPKGYELAAAGKTSDQKFFAVFLAENKVMVKMGDHSWFLQEQPSTLAYRAGQLGSSAEHACTENCRTIGCQSIQIAIYLCKRKHVQAGNYKRLLLFGTEGKIDKGTLGRGDWSCADIKNDDEKIPKKAWLAIYGAKTDNKSVEGQN